MSSQQQPTTDSAPNGADNATSTPDPANLPPAALDLAAKLFDLARAGETETLSTYVAVGVPKNLTNHAGDTLLMLASYHGHLETSKMLLEAGADANVLNVRGQSPIAGAVFKGSDEIVRLLYQNGADIMAGHPTAVDCARMFKRENLLKLFGMEEGAGTDVHVNGA